MVWDEVAPIINATFQSYRHFATAQTKKPPFYVLRNLEGEIVAAAKTSISRWEIHRFPGKLGGVLTKIIPFIPRLNFLKSFAVFWFDTAICLCCNMTNCFESKRCTHPEAFFIFRINICIEGIDFSPFTFSIQARFKCTSILREARIKIGNEKPIKARNREVF